MSQTYDASFAGSDDARVLIRDTITGSLEALRSGFAGTNPPTSPAPVAGQVWFDDNLRKWEYNGTHWVLPPTPGASRGSILAVNTGDANHDTDISAGYFCSDDDYTNIVCPARTGMQLDATWAVGDNQGKLDTGSIANSTWYFLRPIIRLDTRVADYLFSASLSSPTMPTNYTKKGPIIGAVRTNGSSNILAYDAYETAGGGVEIMFRDRQNNASDLAMTAAAQLVGLTVPPIVGLEALLQMSSYDPSLATQIVITNPAQTDVAPARTTGREDTRTSAGNTVSAENFIRRVNSSGEVRFRSAQNTALLVATTMGFRMTRRP